MFQKAATQEAELLLVISLDLLVFTLNFYSHLVFSIHTKFRLQKMDTRRVYYFISLSHVVNEKQSFRSLIRIRQR